MIDSATSLFTNMWQKYVNCLDVVQKFALEVQEFCILVFLLCLTLYGSYWLFFTYFTFSKVSFCVLCVAAATASGTQEKVLFLLRMEFMRPKPASF